MFYYELAAASKREIQTEREGERLIEREREKVLGLFSLSMNCPLVYWLIQGNLTNPRKQDLLQQLKIDKNNGHSFPAFQIGFRHVPQSLKQQPK